MLVAGCMKHVSSPSLFFRARLTFRWGRVMRAPWRWDAWVTGWLVGLAISVAGVTAHAADGKRPPNIVLIVADDLGLG